MSPKKAQKKQQSRRNVFRNIALHGLLDGRKNAIWLILNKCPKNLILYLVATVVAAEGCLTMMHQCAILAIAYFCSCCIPNIYPWQIQIHVIVIVLSNKDNLGCLIREFDKHKTQTQNISV